MGYLQEADCPQLKNAGDEARQRKLLLKNEVLKCPYTGCDRVNCVLLEQPLVRTVFFESDLKSNTLTNPVDAFYERLKKHFALVEIGDKVSSGH